MSTGSKKNGVKGKILSLDEQIALLESQLESGSSSDNDDDYAAAADDDDDDGSSDYSDSGGDGNELLKVEKDSSGQVVRLVSSLDEERIAPLPKNQLPSIHCTFKV